MNDVYFSIEWLDNHPNKTMLIRIFSESQKSKSTGLMKKREMFQHIFEKAGKNYPIRIEFVT
jgi:hypothetical protein